MAATMLWHNEGRVCLLVQTTMNPTNQEWFAYLNAGAAYPIQDRRVIIYTRGGSPNGTQRAELQETFRLGPKPLTAVLTQSTVVRAVGTLFQFWNPLLRMFAPSDEQKAFDYLGLTLAEQQRTRALRTKLDADLDAEARAA